jgi:hypothetical protein
MKFTNIKHPEWLVVSNPQKSIDLFNRGILPNKIAGWCIVVGCKHPLRCVYGSDLRVALALLWQATYGKIEQAVSWRIWTILHPKELEELDEEFKSEHLS